jgi:uridine kinase
MNEAQHQVLRQIASNTLTINAPQPLLLGVDGKDASGKTTFANNLAAVLNEQTQREVIRVSLDDFFQPRAIRSRQTDQARGCYEDTFDNAGIIKYLFNPIRSNNTYTTKIFDYKSDSPVGIISASATPDAIFVIDGVFLQRPEFREYWDYTVLLDVSDETAIERGAVRDTGRIGDLEAAREKYINRYIASQKIYYDECEPQKIASIIIDNTDYENPVVI